MKIEKINDNKIRCTLTSADLAERNLKLSELAYGTEKARSLFQDMMLEANQQFGFNVDNAPLMVEAVPVAPDSIVSLSPESRTHRSSTPASPNLLHPATIRTDRNRYSIPARTTSSTCSTSSAM